MPKVQAVDIYGNSFFDLPPPLDGRFWEQEVMRPFELFLQDFKRPEVGNGICLKGITLDLEMYGRKTTGEFLSTMLAGAEKEPLLLQQHGYKKYFQEVELQAEALGKQIKIRVEKALPNATIIAYAPTINLDWFYQGLYRGLCTKKNPLLLLTFNSFYIPYQKKLEKKRIYTNHGSVLMLGKFQKDSDSEWLLRMAALHNNIWLNRFSRMVQPYEAGAWFTVEQTPLNREQKKKLCSMIADMR